mgnify:CR=1 FL=1
MGSGSMGWRGPGPGRGGGGDVEEAAADRVKNIASLLELFIYVWMPHSCACHGVSSFRPQRRLPATLKEALGEALAWDIVPHSFRCGRGTGGLNGGAVLGPAVGGLLRSGRGEGGGG